MSITNAIYNNDLTYIKQKVNKNNNIINKKDKYKKTPLITASFFDRYDIVNFLLLKGANINVKDNFGCTALMWASLAGNLKIVKLLLLNGANIYEKANNDDSVLIYAIKGNNKKIIKLLLTKINIDLL